MEYRNHQNTWQNPMMMMIMRMMTMMMMVRMTRERERRNMKETFSEAGAVHGRERKEWK